MELQDILAKTSAKVMFTRTLVIGEMRTVILHLLYFSIIHACMGLYTWLCAEHPCMACLHLYIPVPNLYIQILSSESFLVFQYFYRIIYFNSKELLKYPNIYPNLQARKGLIDIQAL